MNFNAAILGSLVLVTNSWQSAVAAPAVQAAALVAKHTIDIEGTNSISFDSYDSSDPAKSTNGHYDPSQYVGDMGDVVANDGAVNALNAGNVRIYGHAHVGAGGSMSIGPNGAVGEHWWQATHSGVEAGWFAADANYRFPDTSFPFTNSTPGVLTSTASGNVVASAGYAYTTNPITSSTLPSPVPWGGVITNSSYFTVTPWSAVPSPTPPGTITNGPFATNSTIWAPGAYFTNTVFWNNVLSYPAPGTYLGTVATNWNPGHTQITGYSYNHITAYAFHYYTYTYPVITYLYNLYTTNAIFQTNHYDNILASGTSYFLNSLTGSTYVAGMDVRLVVANGIDLTQPITIPQSSSIKVWSGGTSIVLTANQVSNQSGRGDAFIVHCSPSVTSLSVNGGLQFTGVIFAPNAGLYYNGGSQSHLDFCGALFVNFAMIYGSAAFHFDEALIYVSPFAPQITGQPASQIVMAGQTATFNVSVAAAAPVFYQWWSDPEFFLYAPTAIVGATNSTLIVTNVGLPNVCNCPGGNYWVVVSNASGTAISSVAELGILYPPVISSQPLSQTVAPGSNVTLVVGCPFITAPLVRQWRFNGSPLPDATNSTLKIIGMTSANVGDYDVIITNLYGSATSDIAHVSIEITPQLGSSLWTTDGQFQFGVAGVPGYQYAVQASTNLADWISLITNASPFTFSDPDAPNFPQRYYRSVYVP